MKESHHNLDEIMEEAMDQKTSQTTFEDTWKMHLLSKRHPFRFGKRFTVPVIVVIMIFSLFTIGFTSFQMTRKVDKTDYDFVDDSRVIGRWQSVDFVRSIEDFTPEVKSYPEDLYLTQLAFVKGGKMLNAVNIGNGKLSPAEMSWTKGLVLSAQEKTASSYEIKDINGTSYMFVQWKSGDYSFRGMTPYYYVLKKVDNDDYSNFQPQMIEDKIDYPFVNDPELIGKWVSVDFVRNIENFKPDERFWADDLYFPGIEAQENGVLAGAKYSTWTKGLILNSYNKTASQYVIKKMNGETYLFMEWKSGDYTYRGFIFGYYVMKKVN